ncbi:MAG: sulfurtransferase [Planctomycetaceae bacterium]
MSSSISAPGSMTAPGSTSAIVNISCYRFVELDRLPERKSAIRRRAVELNLKGTVLLSHEGINLFVAGTQPSIRDFVDFLREDPAFSDLAPKESVNEYPPFNRMLVKIKKEIISFGVDGVAPGVRTSPKLPAQELRKWLDEGRKVHLLDTRNDYEYGIGTFDNAIKLNIDHFREFPEAIRRLPEELKDEPIVMFCTGGIRCEKAGPFMEMAGFRNVYQLDGGILKYFEEVGGEHYHGECFVFDQRVAVDPALKETSTTQCYVCQAVVTAEQQQSPQYAAGKSCPACYRDDAQQMADLIAQRHQQIRNVTSPLPGSTPWINRRPLNVPQRCAGMTLLNFVCSVHPQIEPSEWRHRIESGVIVPAESVRRRRRPKQVSESIPLSPDRLVREGERFDQLQPHSVEPDVNADIRVLHEDDDFLILSKPAPLPIHECGRFHRNSLRYILNLVWFPQRPHMVHRLDANTSGVLVLCKRQRIASVVQKQFENRTVRKTYLARIAGHPQVDNFACDAALSREPDVGGIRIPDPQGDEASTDFTVIERFNDGTALVRCFPRTGRTNQIRAHLWSLGFPICGDPAYLAEGKLGSNRTLSPDEPTMCLHAESIEFAAPDGRELKFADAAPAWASAIDA